MRARAALCAAALCAPALAGAEGWAGFYTPLAPDPPAPAAVSAPAPAPISAPDACTRAILSAQTRYDIPGNLLLAIGLQEAGLRRDGRYVVWPWSVNAAGDGRMFATKAEAQKWVRSQLAVGVDSIDIGCMQVNLHWHPNAFGSLAQAFDPAANVDYAARFLRDLYRRTGDWMQAAGTYHSRNDAERRKYLASLQRNLAVANAGLAARTGTTPPAAPAPIPAAAPAPRPVIQPDIAWSASLSAGKTGRRLSIYSTQDLQPVLPNFTKDF
jgi:hypothetical protein